jgi:hypothetical protein
MPYTMQDCANLHGRVGDKEVTMKSLCGNRATAPNPRLSNDVKRRADVPITAAAVADKTAPARRLAHSLPNEKI